MTASSANFQREVSSSPVPPPLLAAAVMEAPGALPVVGHLHKMIRAPHEYLQSLRAHGDIVRIQVGPSPLYVVTSPELVHQVLFARSSDFERGRVFDKATAAIGKGVIVTNGDFHLRQRRMLQPGFQKARIHGYMETIHRQVDSQTAQWTPGGRVSLREEMHRFTLNAVTRTLFGANTAEGVATEIGEYIDAANAWVSHHTLLSSEFFERLPTPVNRAFVRKKARFDELLGEFIDARRADARDQGDLLSALLASQDAETGKGMSDEQLRIEIAGLFVAGSETTATALSWLFHEVSKHPDVEARIQAEVDSVLGGRPVTAEDLPRLTYIQSVISETLRLYPIAWLLMRRTLHEVELGGYHLPAGVEVLASPIMSHRNARIFPEPMRFDPDRWVPERARELPRYALLPFGDGKHKCMGDMFARTEMVIAVAAITARWRLVPLPGQRVREVPRSVLRPNQILMTTVPRASPGLQESHS